MSYASGSYKNAYFVVWTTHGMVIDNITENLILFLKISIVSPERDFDVMQLLVMFQSISQTWRIHLPITKTPRFKHFSR